MKKCLLVWLSLFYSILLSAQTSGTVAGWYNTDEFIANNAVLGTNYLKLDLLFPDSSVRYKDENGIVKQFSFYSAGHIFDVRHENWAAVPSDPNYPIQVLDANKCDFYLDSIRIKYFYKRKIADTQTVDTVFIYYYNNFDNQQIVQWENTVGFNDTMRAATPYPFNEKAKYGKYYFKKDTVLLTENDTSNAQNLSYMISGIGKYYEAYKSSSSSPRSLFGFSIIYKPGFKYYQNDTLTVEIENSKKARLNLFGVYNSRLKLPSSLKSRRFTENSLFLNYKNAYGSNYRGIKGFVPGTALDSVKYIHCGAFISAVACTLSVKEIKKPINAYIKSVSPNPLQNNSSLNILIKNKQAADYTLEIVNMVGDRVTSKTIFCDNDSEVLTVFEAIPQISSGLYYILLRDNNTNTIIDTKKLIKIF